MAPIITPASSTTSTPQLPISTSKQFGSVDGLNDLEPLLPTSRLTMTKVQSCNAIAALSFNNVYSNIWKVLLHQAMDPHPEVAGMARNLVNTVKIKVSARFLCQNLIMKDTQTLYTLPHPNCVLGGGGGILFSRCLSILHYIHPCYILILASYLISYAY